MAFTTIAFIEDIQGAAAYTELAAALDQHVTVNGDDLQLPSLNQIVLVAAGICSTSDATARRVRLASPSLRERALFQISPINWTASAGGATDAVPNSPQAIMDMRGSPLVLVPREKLNAQFLATNFAADRQHVIVWLADGPIVPVKGPIFSIRCTGGSPAVAGVWTTTALTFEEDLPAGRYQVVGFRPMSTTMVAARLVFVGGGWRPGAYGCDTYYDLQSDIFRFGNMGVWSEFEDLEPPTVEILANAADAAAVQEYWLDLIQIRKGPSGA